MHFQTSRPGYANLPSAIVHAIANGGRGVQLFFAISGLILGLPFANHYLNGAPVVSLKKYFVRRLTRLEPPYVLSMLIMFALPVMRGYQTLSLGIWVKHLVASLFYQHNLIYGQGSLLNGVAWSLEVEVQFYCLVPLLTLIFRVKRAVVRRTALLAVILLLSIYRIPFFEISILGNLQFFMVGFLLSDLYCTEWSRPGAKRSWLYDLLGLAAWPFLFLGNGRWFSVLFPLAIFLAACAVIRGVLLRWILTRSPVTIAGGMCYTIYLYHFRVLVKVLDLTNKYAHPANQQLFYFIQLTAVIVVVGVVSILFFVLVERPCMRRDWPERLWLTFQNLGLRSGGPVSPPESLR